MCTGTLPLHVHWYVHYLVDELRLRYLCSLLHLPDDGHLSPHDDRHIHGFVDELCPGNFVSHLLLWDELHNFNDFLDHVWNRNVERLHEVETTVEAQQYSNLDSDGGVLTHVQFQRNRYRIHSV